VKTGSGALNSEKGIGESLKQVSRSWKGFCEGKTGHLMLTTHRTSSDGINPSNSGEADRTHPLLTVLALRYQRVALVDPVP
jgi:hypothetical protein